LRSQAKNILIAVGGRAVRAPIKGAEHALTSDEILVIPKVTWCSTSPFDQKTGPHCHCGTVRRSMARSTLSPLTGPWSSEQVLL